jgi:hypothetical protein
MMIFLTRGVRNVQYSALSLVLLVVSLLVVAVVPAYAQGNSAIAQGFETKDDGVTAAALVSAERDNPNFIELSNWDKADRLAGIVSENPLIDLSEGGSSVQVVTSGLTYGLVTDLNGEIKSGDKITASPIEGVGMKATESVVVVGTAQGSMDRGEAEERTIKDKDGKDQKVFIGLVPVQVSVSYFSAEAGKASFVPGFLQDLANNVTGRNVSPMRVLVAALILLLLFVSITVLLYSAVRSSIISIGRNPLSESAVRKSLFEVALTIVAVLLFAVLTIYLVLTA